MDSFTILKILIKEWSYPWNILEYIEKIWELITNKQVQFQHIMGEGNQLVDHLTNLTIDKGKFIITSSKQLEVTEKRF